MPKFVEEIIEDLYWTEISFEIPDFPSGSDEEEIRIEDAFVWETIETL